MIIRKAHLNEVPQTAVMALDMLKFHKKYDKFWTPTPQAIKFYRKQHSKAIHSRNSLLLVAEDKGRLVGFSLCRAKKYPPVITSKAYGYISDVFVIPRYRRKGITKLFLDEMFDWMRSKKLDYAELLYAPMNPLAAGAWRKYGFKELLINGFKKL